jgi:spore coat protein U-like protein
LDLIIMNAPPLARCMAVIVPRAARCRLGAPGRLALAAALSASIALSAASFATTKVAVKLQGDIATECAIRGGIGSGAASVAGVAMDLADITKPGRRHYSFTVNCNAPFAYRLEAQYGALTHEGGGVAPAGLAGAVPYEVAMHIPTDALTINDRCSGESIRSGQVRCPFSNSGAGIALGSAAQLTLAWTPGNAVPLAGQYSDCIKIIVGARQ